MKLDPSMINVTRAGVKPAEATLTDGGLLLEWPDGTTVLIPKSALLIEEGEILLKDSSGNVEVTEPGKTTVTTDWETACLEVRGDGIEDPMTVIGQIDQAFLFQAHWEDSPLPFAPLPRFEPPTYEELEIPESRLRQNNKPTIGNLTLRVSDEGLPFGKPDNFGFDDFTNSVIASGYIQVDDLNGDPLTFSLNPLANAGLTSGGVAIVWSNSGSQKVIGTANGNVIFTVTVDNRGFVQVVQSGPLDHPDPTREDELPFQVQVVVSDGPTSATGTLTVVVEDDSPMIKMGGYEKVDEDWIRCEKPHHDEGDNDEDGPISDLRMGGGGPPQWGDDEGCGDDAHVCHPGNRDRDTKWHVEDGDDCGGNMAKGNLGFWFGADGPAPEVPEYEGGPTDLVVSMNVLALARDPKGAPVPVTSGGQTVHTIWDPATDTLTGYIGDVVTDPGDIPSRNLIFTLEFGPEGGRGGPTGEYKFTLHGPLDHPSQNGGNYKNGKEDAWEDNLILQFEATITDGDGDQATQPFYIDVDDDKPTLKWDMVKVDEDWIKCDRDDDCDHDKKSERCDDPQDNMVTALRSGGGQGQGGHHHHGDDKSCYPGNQDKGYAPGDDRGCAVARGDMNFRFGADGPAADRPGGGSRDVDLVVRMHHKAERDDPDPQGHHHDEVRVTSGGKEVKTSWDHEADVLTGYIEERDHRGRVEQKVIFTLDFDPDGDDELTGNFKFTLLGPLDHPSQEAGRGNPGSNRGGGSNGGHDEPDGGYEDNLILKFDVTITDGDGDSVTQTLKVNVDDDMPTVAISRNDQAKFVLDESVGTDGSIKDEGGRSNDDETLQGEDGVIGFSHVRGSSLFTEQVDAGADGLESKVYKLTLAPGNPDSGLVDAVSDEKVILFIYNNGDIVGRTENSGELVFRVHVNEENGSVTVKQFRAVEHDDPNDHDENQQSAAHLNAELIGFQVTVTDGDGDSASDQIEIGRYIRFEDDGPAVEIVRKASAKFVLDESVGTDGSIKDEGGRSNDDETLQGEDGVIGFSHVRGSSLFTEQVDAGADGLQSKVYKLILAPGNPDSGLMDAASDEKVILFIYNNGDVVGRTENSGELVFRVHVNEGNGSVTVKQFRAVEHDDPNDHDENQQSAAHLNAELIGLQVTVTDGDGDSASDQIEIGRYIRFEDDGPSFGEVRGGLVDEDFLDNGNMDRPQSNPSPGDDGGSLANAELIGRPLNVDFGADGPGSFKIDLTTVWATTKAPGVRSELTGTDFTSGGLPVKIDWDSISRTLTGFTGDDSSDPDYAVVFKLEVAEDYQSYDFTLEQSLDHLYTSEDGQTDGVNGFEDNLELRFTATIEDGDGDTATRTFSINVDDDIPTIITQAEDLNLLSNQDGSVSGMADFEYSIGADGRHAYSQSNSDFKSINLCGSVNGETISDAKLIWISENDDSAEFEFSFEYASGKEAEGTLEFDKASGKYSVTLDVEDGGGASHLSQNVSDIESDNGPVESVVAKLSDDLFVQFTGEKKTNGKNGVDLEAGSSDPDAYTNEEVFTAAPANLIISNDGLGVADNNLHRGDILNLDFYSTDPSTDTSAIPNSAAGITIGFTHSNGGNGNTEDVIVLLKLVNSDGTPTTRILVIDTEDFYRESSELPAGYNVDLGNNDSFVIIESNDYNSPGENYQIIGAQILTSSEGITGPGIDYNREVGESGASTGTKSLSQKPDKGSSNGGTHDNDVVKITSVGIIAASTEAPEVDLEFKVTIHDGDGDATSEQTLSVSNVSGGDSVVTPVTLDLDGDGLEFIPLSEQLMFDFDGDGNLDQSAWVGPDDALLAIDLNGDGLVNDGSEVVFTQHAEGAETDLEGLALAYDSNHDGVLDANDDEFSLFGVWQDKNSNGITEEGEFMSLEEAGIVSIDLSGDGNAYTAAEGDVYIYGESSFTKADGETGAVGDAAFAVEYGSGEEMPDLSELLSDSDDAMDALLDSFGSDAPGEDGGSESSGSFSELDTSGDSPTSTAFEGLDEAVVAVDPLPAPEVIMDAPVAV